MRLRMGVGVTVGVAALATAVLVGPNANASQADVVRPCSPGVTSVGTGTLGTPWILKAQFDNDGAQPVVGVEFEINTRQAGQPWNIQLADNGFVFFDKTVTSGATGVTAMGMTPIQPGTDQALTANAVDLNDGEHINAQVILPGPPPSRCGVR